MENVRKVSMFQIGDLLPIGMTFVVLVIAIAYGLKVMGDVKTQMTTNSNEANATADGIAAVKKITDNLGTIVTIVIAAVIIGVLISYLAVRFMK